jgi:hypothetical protein
MWKSLKVTSLDRTHGGWPCRGFVEVRCVMVYANMHEWFQLYVYKYECNGCNVMDAMQWCNVMDATGDTQVHWGEDITDHQSNIEETWHYLLSNKVIAYQDNDWIFPTTIQMIACQGNLKRYIIYYRQRIACQDNDRTFPTTIQMIACQGMIKKIHYLLPTKKSMSR